VAMAAPKIPPISIDLFMVLLLMAGVGAMILPWPIAEARTGSQFCATLWRGAAGQTFSWPAGRGRPRKPGVR